MVLGVKASVRGTSRGDTMAVEGGLWIILMAMALGGWSGIASGDSGWMSVSSEDSGVASLACSGATPVL